MNFVVNNAEQREALIAEFEAIWQKIKHQYPDAHRPLGRMLDWRMFLTGKNFEKLDQRLTEILERVNQGREK